MKHGTRGTYVNGCRCVECKSANSAYTISLSIRRSKNIPDNIHGHYLTYSNYRCRCDVCKEAQSIKYKDYYKKVSKNK